MSRDKEFTPPSEWSVMPGDEETVHDYAWWHAYTTPDVPEDGCEALLVSSVLKMHMPHARIIRVQRVQHRALYDNYIDGRGKIERDNEGQSNERLLFHGTGSTARNADV